MTLAGDVFGGFLSSDMTLDSEEGESQALQECKDACCEALSAAVCEDAVVILSHVHVPAHS
jgi:hypothetical protein